MRECSDRDPIFRREGPVAKPQHDRDVTGIEVGGRQIQMPILVEIGDGESCGSPSDAQPSRLNERSVASTQKYGDVGRIDACEGDILMPIGVEVGYDNRGWIVSDLVVRWCAELSVSAPRVDRGNCRDVWNTVGATVESQDQVCESILVEVPGGGRDRIQQSFERGWGDAKTSVATKKPEGALHQRNQVLTFISVEVSNGQDAASQARTDFRAEHERTYRAQNAV